MRKTYGDEKIIDVKNKRKWQKHKNQDENENV